MQVGNERLQESCDLMRALAHPVRLRILEFVDRNRAINVNKIYNSLELEQSITSQHLKILRATGLMHAHREGKYILYSIDYQRLEIAIQAVQNFSKFDFHYDFEEEDYDEIED